jgi:lysyl-tRNA synthetase class 1
MDMHWADNWAEKVVEYRGNKDTYVCASAVTPSGYCHIGHLRETLSSLFVSKGLEKLGKKVRIIHGWDDYDRFRKVPQGVGKEFEQYIGMPVCEVPDPFGCHKSYAKHFSTPFEEELKNLGITPHFIDHSTLWKGCKLTDNIVTAMKRRAEIIGILDKFREKPLEKSWYPVEVYCKKCRKDTTEIKNYDENYMITYKCECGFEEKIDVRKAGNVKLKWRVDWPSKWNYFKIDFESAGKDHYASGGSRDTGNLISKDIFGYAPPLPLEGGYEFVSLKGMKGKMSSSKGELVTTSTLLGVMTPELIKFLYLKSRPEKEIVFSFDLDLANLYNYYDKAERIYFGKEEGDEKEKRVYELSEEKVSPKMSTQLPFGLMVTVAQTIPEAHVKEVLERAGYSGFDERKMRSRLICAREWAEKYAPEDMKVSFSKEKVALNDSEKKILRNIYDFVTKNRDSSKVHDYIYEVAKESGLEPKQVFSLCYRVLLGKEHGPKLGYFLLLLDSSLLKERFVT